MFPFQKYLSAAPMLSGLLLALFPLTALSADTWGTKPLGKAIEEPDAGPPPIKQKLESRFRAYPVEGQPTLFFQQGKAQCLLIIPDEATLVEKRAATLLKSSLEKMTGGTFPICLEAEVAVQKADDGTAMLRDSDSRSWRHALWIGNTKYAVENGLRTSHLQPEGYQIVTRGPWLFIQGRDMAPNQVAVQGTYFAAASLLERHFGFRWLWPGEAGTIVPQSKRVELPPIHEQDEPALPKRTIRNMAVNDRAGVGLEILKINASDYRNTLDLCATWLANQRTGSSISLAYGHAYDRWYDEFGAEHPEWFALQPNGSRQQNPVRARLCKSNPAVAHQAALQVLADYARNPNLDCASISPNDGGPNNWFCMCEECRKLDPENGPPVTLLFARDGKRFEQVYPSLTNRFVTFYNRIAEEVVKTRPDARMGAYAYSAYRDVPLGITLHPSIVVGFVGLVYDNDTQRKQDLARWDGWCSHASRLLLRPNAFHAGDALPMIYPHRLAADVKHCYQTGMIAADFDSLVGNWAAEGLNYYVLAKLLWDPALDVEAIIKDYCENGFGPAAEPVSRYFKAMEEASTEVAKQDSARIEAQLREEERDFEEKPSARNKRMTAFQVAYFNVFTPDLIASLRDLLHQADEKASGDKALLARIALLKTGIDYAELYQRTLATADNIKEKQALLAWYRRMSQEEPMAINSVYRLWKTSKDFRSLK